MGQSLMGCKERLTLSKDCPVETCHKEREHVGPHAVKYVIPTQYGRSVKIEIRWEVFDHEVRS